jgi:hypothetical protein
VLSVVIVATATVGVSSHATAQVSGPGDQVQLLTPGKGPRAVVQLDLSQRGFTRTVTVRQKTTTTTAGRARVTVGPFAFRMGLSVFVAPMFLSDQADLNIVYGSFQLLPGSSVGSKSAIATLRRGLTGLDGLTGDFLVDSTGAVLSGSLTPPPSADPMTANVLQQLQEQIGRSTVALPTDPIAVGARWRATTTLSLFGATIAETTDYTLVRRQGSHVVIDSTFNETADSQPFAFPGLPAGVTADLTHVAIRGAGSTVLDLSQPLATTAHGTAQGSEQLTIEGSTPPPTAVEAGARTVRAVKQAAKTLTVDSNLQTSFAITSP